MASKVYAICCKFNGINNLPLYNFIYNQKAHDFELCNDFMMGI